MLDFTTTTAEMAGPRTPLTLASHQARQPFREALASQPTSRQHSADPSRPGPHHRSEHRHCDHSDAATRATAPAHDADRNSGKGAEQENDLSRLTTPELTRLGFIRSTDARAHQSLHPLIHGVSVIQFEVARRLPSRKSIAVIMVMTLLLLLMGWGMTMENPVVRCEWADGQTIFRTFLGKGRLGKLGYGRPCFPLSSSSSSFSSSVSWAPVKDRSAPGDPVLQAQIQIGLLREEISELATWGYYPAIGSAVLLDERERIQEGKDEQDRDVAQANNTDLILPDHDYVKESVGAFEALNAVAPRVLGRQMLDDIDALVQDLHELDDHRTDLPQIERRLEAFAVVLSDLSNRPQDAYTLNQLFHLRDQLHAYLERSINPTTSALVLTTSTILDQIPQSRLRLDTIERDVNTSLASSPAILRNRFNRRFMDAACAAFLPPRNLDSHGRHRPNIVLDGITDPGDCLKGLVATSQSLLHQIHRDILMPYHVYLLKTNFTLERAGGKLTRLTSASLQHHCRLKNAHLEANGQDQMAGWMEQCQTARLADELQESIEDIWHKISHLQATLDDYKDFERQLRFYWPSTWWTAWVMGRAPEKILPKEAREVKRGMVETKTERKKVVV